VFACALNSQSDLGICAHIFEKRHFNIARLVGDLIMGYHGI
jgi:hypothetical protein